MAVMCFLTEVIACVLTNKILARHFIYDRDLPVGEEREPLNRSFAESETGGGGRQHHGTFESSWHLIPSGPSTERRTSGEAEETKRVRKAGPGQRTSSSKPRQEGAKPEERPSSSSSSSSKPQKENDSPDQGKRVSKAWPGQKTKSSRGRQQGTKSAERTNSSKARPEQRTKSSKSGDGTTLTGPEKEDPKSVEINKSPGVTKERAKPSSSAEHQGAASEERTKSSRDEPDGAEDGPSSKDKNSRKKKKSPYPDIVMVKGHPMELPKEFMWPWKKKTPESSEGVSENSSSTSEKSSSQHLSLEENAKEKSRSNRSSPSLLVTSL